MTIDDTCIVFETRDEIKCFKVLKPEEITAVKNELKAWIAQLDLGTTIDVLTDTSYEWSLESPSDKLKIESYRFLNNH